MIKKLLERITTVTETSYPKGRTVEIPGLFRLFASNDGECGSIVLFRTAKRWGWVIHSWNRVSEEWAQTRVWWLGLVSILHVDAGPDNELKHCTKPGWHVRFAKIELNRIYGGFSITFKSADKGYTA